MKRRAWRERHVRLWVVLGLALLGVTLYYGGSRSWWWWREKRLIENGVKVQAEVMSPYAGVDWPAGKVLSPDTPVDIKYTAGGKEHRPYGLLAGRKEQIKTRTMVPIYVDRSDPTRWTARTEPARLSGELLGAFMLAPGAVLLLVVAWWKRRQVLRVYRDGEAVLAEVMGVGQTPSAPFSRLIRCAMDRGQGVTLVKTILPASKRITPGGLIWLIVPPGKSEPAIAAALFE